MSIPHDPTFPTRGGRGALWLGLACAALGLLLYAAQTSAARLDTPWYAPALATVGAGLVLAALWRHPSPWRVLALVVVALLAGFEWWFLAWHARLPDYAGPLQEGTPFPAFRAARADGSPFTRADLEGEHDTALVFF